MIQDDYIEAEKLLEKEQPHQPKKDWQGQEWRCGMNVTVELDELVALHAAAKLSNYRQTELERVMKVNAALQIECERQAREINGLRCELSTRPTTREVSPLLRQKIENAKDVLRQITPVVADCDGNYREVEGDRFNTVYITLRELYDVTRAEVQ